MLYKISFSVSHFHLALPTSRSIVHKARGLHGWLAARGLLHNVLFLQVRQDVRRWHLRIRWSTWKSKRRKSRKHCGNGYRQQLLCKTAFLPYQNLFFFFLPQFTITESLKGIDKTSQAGNKQGSYLNGPTLHSKI